MDAHLRRSERLAGTGDPDASRRHDALLRRCGIERAQVPVEDRIRLGLFDVLTTILREDIIQAALQVAEEGEQFVHGVNLDPAWWPVELWVNGRRLSEVVGGGFRPDLPAHAVYLPTRYLLGDHYEQEWWSQWCEPDRKRLLLFGSCGEECCGLWGHITTSDVAVVWSDLERGPFERKPLPEAVFVFARREYEAALCDPKPPALRIRGGP